MAHGSRGPGRSPRAAAVGGRWGGRRWPWGPGQAPLSHEPWPPAMNNRLANELFDYILEVLRIQKCQSLKVPKSQSFKVSKIPWFQDSKNEIQEDKTLLLSFLKWNVKKYWSEMKQNNYTELSGYSFMIFTIKDSKMTQTHELFI